MPKRLFEIFAELTVIDAATNLVIDISELPISAAIMTSLDPDASFYSHQFRGNYSRYKSKPQLLFSIKTPFMKRVKIALGR